MNKRSESERNHAINASRLHLMQFAITHSLDELLEETLNEAENLTGSLIGFYHFVDDNQVSLTLQNWSTRTKAEFCKAKGKGMHYPIADAGVWVECVYQRKPVIHNDYASLSHRKGMPDGHAAVTRELVVPVMRGDKIKAILGVGNKPSDYHEKDEETISLLADLAWETAERKRAEESLLRLNRELRESEARFRRIVDTAAEGIWVLGPDTMTTFVNARMTEILGCPGEEIMGRPLTEFMFEEDVPDHWRKMESRRKGTSECYERRLRRKDGRTVWTLVSATPVLDNEHNFSGSFGMFTDITERKRAEEALQRKTEELDRYFSTALDLLCIANTDGCFSRLNPQWESTLGFPVAELEGRRFLDFVHPDDVEATLQAISRLAEQKEVLNFINRYRCKDGSYRWIEWRSYPSGTRIYAVARDITTRLEAEGEIRRLKNYLADIINSMPSIIVGLDREETVTQWNRRAEEISGIPAAEAVGRPITDLLPDFSPWIEAMRGEVGRRRPASTEKLLIEKGGEGRFYDLMLYPIVTDGAEGTVIRIEDATERARIQELMIQTEKMMSVGGLAAGMAHEINNPLGIITQAAQNIERRVSPELPANRQVASELGVGIGEIKAYFERRRIPEFIGSIRTAALRAAKIVDNMLQFSRRSGTNKQPVSLAWVVDQALELAASDFDLKKRYDFKGIEIVRDYAHVMPEVPMVAVEIEQVMLNLLKNAAQAMIANHPGRRPRITLRLRREERYALIEVEDNGPGMTEEIRHRVFEPFFTTKEPGVGTGLGLSVSYMIVTQNHKGLMEVESKPGKGACFRIRLPLSTECTNE